MKFHTILTGFLILTGLTLGTLATAASPVAALESNAPARDRPGNVLTPLDSLPGIQFVHTATPSNIIFNWTIIDHPLINADPNAIIFVTQNWNPGGEGEIYNNHNIGVWYDDVTERWAIFNQNESLMPQGAAFNVLIPDADLSVFVHTASAANIIENYTEIDNPLSNNNSDALVFITQNWNPGNIGGTYNDHPVGVWYDSLAQKWAVFNEDGADMPEDAAFNVLISDETSSEFVHTATLGNSFENWTMIDHPHANNNPAATLFVTQNWNPGGSGGQYNAHPIGVWYISGTGNWAIFNQDEFAIPSGAAFNIIVSERRIFIPLVVH